MTLHLCLNCATIYDCAPHHKLTCPQCEGPLELREQVREEALSLVLLALRAAHGEAPERRVRWRVG